MLVPMLAVSSYKKQLLHETLELELGAILSGQKAALGVRDFSISLAFCRTFCFSLCICNSQSVLEQGRGGSKLD